MIKPAFFVFLPVGEEAQSRQHELARALFADPAAFRRDQPCRQAETGRGDAGDLVLLFAMRRAVCPRAIARQPRASVCSLLKLAERTAGEVVEKRLVLRRQPV